MYAEPEVAVQSYIDALLCDPVLAASAHPDSAQPGVASTTLSPDNAAASAVTATALPVSDDAPAIAEVSDQTTVPAISPRQQAFVQHLARAQQKGGATAARRTPHPEWAEDEFSCLLVHVANLKLAIPCCFIDSTIACVPGQASGNPESILMPCDASLGQQVMTADTAKIVMPERYETRMRQAYRHKVLLRDCDIALAVDNIVGEVSYRARQVRWRGAYTRRFWLAGTVIQDMCALLDVEAIHREVLANQVLGSDDTRSSQD